jgi:glutathione S-transferase
MLLLPRTMSTGSSPTLWHIAVSHYSEKARWALDYKEVAHTRRAVAVPGLHIPASIWMTRGTSQTYPVLEMEGRRIGDSTEIIAALEERFPEPPLYPADPSSGGGRSSWRTSPTRSWAPISACSPSMS